MRAFMMIRQVFFVSLLTIISAHIQAGAETGSATTTMSLVVPVVTSVSCSSAQVTAPTGNQTNTLAVVCTITGNPNSMAATGNSFSPSSVTMTNASSQTLSATLQSGITSPDSSITGITGNSSGFSGTLGAGSTWKVQAHYTVPTTSAAPSGTYTSGTVTYAWSTL